MLAFDESGNCTVTSASDGVVAGGNGKFVSKGDKNSWGGKDRDVLYLDYTMDYDGIHCATKDTLVVHYRGKGRVVQSCEEVTKEGREVHPPSCEKYY